MEVLREMFGSLALILVSQLVVFAVIVVVLRKLLLGDTMNAVKRLKGAEGDLARKEDAMRQKMEQQEQEFLKKKAVAEEEMERHRAASEQDVARMRDRTKAEAKVEADKIISDAQLNKEKIREQIVREASGKAVEYAGDLFKLVVSRTVTEKLNAAFVDELIAGLSEVDETSVFIEASEAEFIASHKLDQAQKAKLESLLAEKFGVTLKINEKIDESLLAGMTIKLGSLEIDGSLLNRYREGVGELKKSV
jgi:F0F1-type ATP synthase delta subunit